jgi:hypothetical protein
MFKMTKTTRERRRAGKRHRREEGRKGDEAERRRRGAREGEKSCSTLRIHIRTHV